MYRLPLAEYLGILAPDAAAVLREHIGDGIDRGNRNMINQKT